jgi:hypothetical protein
VTTILRYLDNQGRPKRQADPCDTHTGERCAVEIDHRRKLRGGRASEVGESAEAEEVSRR